jgi:Cu(I)/Ag(I) efflux system membrane protein CusA/SilA
VGGMITSTILTLVVIPAIYYLWKNREVKRVAAEIKNQNGNEQEDV